MFIIPDFSVIRSRKGYTEIQSSIYNIMMTFFMIVFSIPQFLIIFKFEENINSMQE